MEPAAVPLFAKGYGSHASKFQTTASSTELDLNDDLPDAAHPSSSFPVEPTPASTSDAPASKILDFLYLGSVNDALNAQFIKEENITTILNVSTEKYWGVTPDVVVHTIPVPDISDFAIDEIFPKCFKVIDWVRRHWFRRDKPRVLVHCQKGRSRSATVVLAYLMQRNGWSFAEALEFTKRRRPCIDPNVGFVGTLQALDEQTRPEVRVLLRKRCTLTFRNVRPGLTADQVKSYLERKCADVHAVASNAPQTQPAESEAANRPSLFMVSFACHEYAKIAAKLFNGVHDDFLCESAADKIQVIVHDVTIKSKRRKSDVRTRQEAEDGGVSSPPSHSQSDSDSGVDSTSALQEVSVGQS